LIAFLFDFLGDCPDTTSVKIDFIEFTDEFKGQIKEYKDAVATAELIEKETRHLTASFNKDTLFFENKKQDELILKFDYGIETKIKNADFELVLSDNNFHIDDIIPLTDKIEITDKIENENVLLVKTFFKDTISGLDALKVLISENTQNEDTCRIKINNLHPNDCSCVTRVITMTFF